ncbi:MAG: hypothetical protein IID61_17740 [SAR324 cluster bacterium]|nr:hypothetical protein [SAR324 cluster bacterium]
MMSKKKILTELIEIIGVRWTCSDCGAVIEYPLGQERNVPSMRSFESRWLCPVCKEETKGDENIAVIGRYANAFNKFLTQLALLKDQQYEISFLTDPMPD